MSSAKELKTYAKSVSDSFVKCFVKKPTIGAAIA